MLDAVLDRFGGIDVLFNNAAGQFKAPAEEITPNGWRAVHRLTLDAAWNLTHQVATRSMIPREGGLIVFNGFSPRRGIPGFAHATAARAALENLAAGLAVEWSRFGIRSVCVSIGSIETEGLASYGPDSLEEARRQVPLGRLGTPQEVGELIAFLATSGGAYVNGTTVVVDGGVDAWGLGEPPPPPEARTSVSPAGQPAGRADVARKRRKRGGRGCRRPTTRTPRGTCYPAHRAQRQDDQEDRRASGEPRRLDRGRLAQARGDAVRAPRRQLGDRGAAAGRPGDAAGPLPDGRLRDPTRGCARRSRPTWSATSPAGLPSGPTPARIAGVMATGRARSALACALALASVAAAGRGSGDRRGRSEGEAERRRRVAQRRSPTTASRSRSSTRAASSARAR